MIETFNLFKMYKQTNLITGEGSCATNGTTNDKAFFCPNGAECNNFAGKSCWDPLSGKAAVTLCNANEWQCKVSYALMFNLFILNSLLKCTAVLISM